ncbi:MAG: hypothetical protein OXF08_06450 [Bacteroidetes bacterium]|nr:hypothetical protein [Bacteroidota bacterium]
MIRKTWSAQQADEWTKEDWIAIVLSPLCYVLITIGAALAILLQISGFIMLLIGIVLTVYLHLVIDPKLKAISNEYETKQQDYLRELEAKVRWKSINQKEP